MVGNLMPVKGYDRLVWASRSRSEYWPGHGGISKNSPGSFVEIFKLFNFNADAPFDNLILGSSTGVE